MTSGRLKQFLVSITAFVITLALSWVLAPSLPWGPWRIILGLSPIFPAISVGYVVARSVGELDELQQRIQLEALAFSLANTTLLALTLGLLERYESVNMVWALPMALIFWRIGFGMARRRYQ